MQVNCFNKNRVKYLGFYTFPSLKLSKNDNYVIKYIIIKYHLQNSSFSSIVKAYDHKPKNQPDHIYFII